MKIIFNCAGWINFRKLINTLYLFAILFHQLMLYYQYLHYTICISGITHYASKYHPKSLFNAHWNLFWSKSSMGLPPEFHGTFWTTPVVPWNSMQLKQQNLKFHGIQLNSMEPLVWAKLAQFKFHGIPWNRSCQRNWRNLSSMKFQWTACVSEIGALHAPWNSK